MFVIVWCCLVASATHYFCITALIMGRLIFFETVVYRFPVADTMTIERLKEAPMM